MRALFAGTATVSPNERGLAGAAGIGAATFAVAFAAAPRSCAGGLGFYFWFGVAATLAMLAMPFVVHRDRSLLIRIGWSAGLALSGAAIWIAGMFVANVRIICRLF